MSAIDPLTSRNFATAKVLAILLVATGHFFEGSLLWIPVTVGLFVFAYSSALFTTRKHGADFAAAPFWRSKLQRLGVRFLIIQAALLAFVAVRGADGILTWQTLVHLAGQSGWLNWFGIPNRSPLGGGLWFFTLLLLFYLAFPVLARLQADRRRSLGVTAAALLLALWLSRTIDVGHALWITAAAFVAGIHAGRHPVPGSARQWFAVAAAGTVCLLVLNVGFAIKPFNLALIVVIALAGVQWLEKTRMTLPCGPLAHLSPCLLEIYLIHTYLFVGGDWPRPIAYVTSMAIIVACALALNRLAEKLEPFLLRHPRSSRLPARSQG